ncbi:MAG: polysaccharide biosynthesis tyrosine autokinase [Steroidobacteraceae bacterium]
MATVIKSPMDNVAAQPEFPLIGELLLHEGTLTERDIARIVATQREGSMRFGEAGRSLGLLHEHDVTRVLARQFGYSYVVQGGDSKLAADVFSARDPFSARAEAIRGLRSQLALTWFNERRRSLAVVGSDPDAGSSIVAANLAIAFAQLGERTLLIDASLRSPNQQTLFGIAKADGLSSILAGRSSFKNALSSVEEFPQLSLLCAGPYVPNPQELLSRISFAYLMETVPASFDVVIVDAPPVLDFADAQIIAAKAGGCLLVARRHRTRLADLERSRSQLEASGSLLLGTVLND